MHKTLSQALRRRFTNELLIACPQFGRPTRDPNGHLIFRMKHPRGLTFYLQLIVRQQQDSFTLGLAWAKGDSMPEFHGIRDPWDPPDEDGLTIRAWRLWRHQNADFFWKATPHLSISEELELLATDRYPPEDTLVPTIEEAASDAVLKVKEYVVPYIEQVAEKYGQPASEPRGRVTQS